MQTSIRRALLLAPAAAVLLTGIAFQRYNRQELPRNSTSIAVLDQGHFTASEDSDRWALPGWDNYMNQHRSVATAGCQTLAYAHAIQWITGEVRGDTLMDELLQVCKNPSDQEYYSHIVACKGLHDPSIYSKEAYDNHLQTKYGIRPTEIDQTHEALSDLFQAGGAMVALMPGHYVAAVEMRTIQGENYVHIIDSNWGTTCRKGFTMFFLEEPDRLIRIFHTQEDTYYSGSDYWIPYSEFHGWIWKTPLLPPL